MIRNPILTGFHPDPSICRVGDDYFIASSTFQWLPAVRLHHSRDLVHWQFIGCAVTRPSQIDLIGVEDNAGVWAPCLSYSDGQFHVIFTDVKTWTGAYKDAHNYLITAPDIRGPWSDPIYLNSSGFDPSLFHDDDGRKWLLNMEWDHRVGNNPFSGILLQEYDPLKKRLTGPVKNIFSGTSLGLVEGPHLYKKDSWYYLLTAEGGTSWDHAATLARSRSIDGPYKVMPGNPLITSANDPSLPLQRAGHGSLVETQSGQWYLAHLAGRPVMPERRCILGRETALQRLIWDEGQWPRSTAGGNSPSLETDAPDLPAHPFPKDARTVPFFDDFDTPRLSPELNTLRVYPDESMFSLSARPGHLRLFGRESLYSKHRQSLVAKRINDFEISASAVLEFAPKYFQQTAGLIFYYDTVDYHYLYVTAGPQGRRIGIFTCEASNNVAYPNGEVDLEWDGPVYLKGELRYAALQFFFAQSPDSWRPLGPSLDATVISDEYKVETKFTGAFAGICAQDLTGRRLHADFDWFRVDSLSTNKDREP